MERLAPASRHAVALRPAHSGDAPLFHRWRSEPSVRRYQPLREMTIAELRAELADLRPSDLWRDLGERFQWVITFERAPVGWITLLVVSWEHGLAELGYALTTEFQGRGLMAPALTLLLRDLFTGTSLARLEARVAVGNVASERVLEQLGFKREGLLRGYFQIAGLRVDNYLYALLRGDWSGRQMRGA